MKFTITRINKQNKLMVSSKTVERFLERIAKDDAKLSVTNFRMSVPLMEADYQYYKGIKEWQHVYPAAEFNKDESGNLVFQKSNGLVMLHFINLMSEQEKDAFCERFGVRLLTSYGMTETIVGIIGDRPGDKRRWPSIGRAGFCYEAEIRDDHNCPLPAGEIGEICIKGVPGKTIFKEYFLNPKATAKVLEADGWLHTGDTGYRDEEGFFYFVDRRCNMIKRGGENVSCVELENIIATHPKIQDIVVVGIKDSIRDEAIKAFVVLNEGETLSEEEFFRFCEQNMAKFKVPSYLEIRKDLPRNCSGKIIRKNLK